MNGCIDMVNLCIFLAHPALDYLDQEPRGLVLQDISESISYSLHSD